MWMPWRGDFKFSPKIILYNALSVLTVLIELAVLIVLTVLTVLIFFCCCNFAVGFG